jgi:hypothetical protein
MIKYFHIFYELYFAEEFIFYVLNLFTHFFYHYFKFFILTVSDFIEINYCISKGFYSRIIMIDRI